MTPFTLVTESTTSPAGSPMSVSVSNGTLFSIARPLPNGPTGQDRSSALVGGDQFVGDAANHLVRWVWDRITDRCCSKQVLVDRCRSLWPLVLSGPSGVGKSLVADCVSAQLQTLFSGDVISTSADDLVRGFLAAGDVNAVEDWVSRHENAAVLVIDPIARLADFPTVQLLLCEIIDQRNQVGLPTVFVTVEAIGHCRLLDRLASRLAQGLTCPLATPGQEAMSALVRLAFARLDIPISEEQILWLWKSGLRSVPTLQQVASRWLLECGRVPFVGALAPESIKLLLGCSRLTPVTPEAVLRLTAKFFQLSVKDLRGASRAMNCSRARALAMWICRQHLKISYQRIGELFGNRDHSTVLSSCKKIEASLPTDAFLQNALQQLLYRLALQ
ncbi:MAG: hypothetical protein JNL67_00345 [Planctomycetaceae bacterium]|nr:hypothetical protein [Planctomycetaceae bacterium]